MEAARLSPPRSKLALRARSDKLRSLSAIGADGGARWSVIAVYGDQLDLRTQMTEIRASTTQKTVIEPSSSYEEEGSMKTIFCLHSYRVRDQAT